MTPQKGKKFRTSQAAERIDAMQVKHPRAAGVDVHSATHFVALREVTVDVNWTAIVLRVPDLIMTSFEAAP